jgi:hypothetical protein
MESKFFIRGIIILSFIFLRLFWPTESFSQETIYTFTHHTIFSSSIPPDCGNFQVQPDTLQALRDLDNFFQLGLPEEDIVLLSERLKNEVYPRYPGLVCNLQEYLEDINETLELGLREDEIHLLVQATMKRKEENPFEIPLKLPTGAKEGNFSQDPNRESAPYFTRKALHYGIFIQKSDSPYSWNSTTMNIARTRMNEAANWFTSKDTNNAITSITNVTYDTPITVAFTNDCNNTWMDTAAQQMGYTDVNNLASSLKSAYNVDRVALLFLISEDDRAQACPYVEGGGAGYDQFAERAIIFSYRNCSFATCDTADSGVYKHETLHLYGACDEYASSNCNTGCGECTITWPTYRGLYPNSGNCEACNPSPDTCVMRSGAHGSSQNNEICYWTKGQVGWNDFDGDGTVDPHDDQVVPVDLASFTATAGDRHILLKWRTESEIDNYGWNIYRSSSPKGDYVKINSSIIPGAGTSSSAHNYFYIDKELSNGTTYYYFLEDIDLKGERHQNRSLLANAIPYEEAPPILITPSEEKDEGLRSSEMTKTNYSLKPQLFPPTKAKIIVDREGIYRLTYKDLLAAGIDPSSINLRNLYLTNKGRPVPLSIKGAEDGIFGKKDYLEFEGTFNRGSYTYEDIYTRNNVYWLSWEGLEEPIWKISPIVEEESSPEKKYINIDTLHFEEDRVYSPLGYAPDGQRDHWFWRKIDAPNSSSFSFILKELLPSSPKYLLKLRLQGNSHLPYCPDHKAAIYLNNIILGEVQWDDQNDYILKRYLPAEYFVEGENVLKIEAIGTGGEIDSFFFDWFEISYPKTSLLKKELLKPLAIVPDYPSDLRNPNNQADYLIITHKDFFEQALTLAYHQQSKGLRTKIVNITNIYDEFSYGIFNPEAIREFLKFAYSNWQKPAPQYVLLLGAANLDYKDNSHTGIKNYVPTYPYFSRGYGQTASDHWFVCLEGDDAIPEMSIGRLPAHTPREAEIMIDKVINYNNNGLNDEKGWRNKVLFVNGGYNPLDEQFFDTSSESLISNYLKDRFEALRVYNQPSQEGLFVYQGSTEEIEEQLNKGVALVNFLGHGAMKTWDLMFRHQDIARLKNGKRLPFILSMTCFTGDFANKIKSQVIDSPHLLNPQSPQILSSTPSFLIQPEIGDGFGEYFVKHEGGGAIAFWGTTALGFILGDSYLNDELFQVLFIEKVGSIGKAIDMATKRFLTKYPAYQDLIYTFVLLGDPALNLTLGW